MYLVAKPKNEDHVPCRLALRLEGSEFFQVQEPISKGKARNFSKSQGFYTERKLHATIRTSLFSMLRSSGPRAYVGSIFPSPRACIRKEIS